jgi:uncharacterized protein (TIGR03067 family)
LNVILLTAALAVGAPALKDPPTKGSGIVGVWAVESVTVGGQARPAKAAPDLRYEFTADGQWFARRGDAAVGKSPKVYKADPKADPPTIDAAAVTPANGAPEPPMAGIYKIDGDTLTLCFSTGGGERPAKFESPNGGRAVLIVLKRAKKE